MEPTASNYRRVLLAALLILAVFTINSWVTDYVADIRGRKELGVQIERMKSQPNAAHLNEADAKNLAQTKLSAAENENYPRVTAFLDTFTQVWTVAFNANPGVQRTDHRNGPIVICVDDTTRVVSRSDSPLPAKSPD